MENHLNTNKIPTAEEFYLNKTGWETLDTFEEFDHPKDIVNYMIAFAKLHVEAALKEASDKVTMRTEIWNNISGSHERKVVNIQSILNAYPLENIK